MTTSYAQTIWSSYANNFLPITSTHMVQVSESVSMLASGNVCDFGTGCCKIGPYLLNNPKVTSLTGVDYTLEMIESAKWHLEQFNEHQKPTMLIHGKIEDLLTKSDDLEVTQEFGGTVSPKSFDFGLSINSFYTWPEPKKVLKTIYQCLKDGASLILVTPNPRLDMKTLLNEVKMQLVGSPHFQSFADQNMEIVGNEKALFLEMDELIELCRNVGFRVKAADDSRFYNGGLNFLHLIK